MIGELGPRTLACKDKNGVEGAINITINGQGTHSVDLGDGATFEEVRATVTISSEWFDRTMRTGAADELQAIFDLIRVADICIQQICQENEIEVSMFKVGELVADFGTFR